MPIASNHKEALKIYEGLPKQLKCPSLHPDYIVADAINNPEWTPIFFYYSDKTELFYYGFLLGSVPGTDFFDIQSPYGYGGPISTTDDSKFLSQAWNEFKFWCTEKRILAEFIRFHPVLSNWKYFNNLVMPNRYTVVMDLVGGDPMKNYMTRVRTAVRKAKNKGLHVEWVHNDNFKKIFINMYYETMIAVGADPGFFFKEDYFQKIIEFEYAKCALCYQDGKAVAAAILFAGPDLMEYHLSASTPLGRKFNATNLILHEAALLGHEYGCRYLHLGGGSDQSKNNPLFFFKAGFSPIHLEFKIGKMIHDEQAYKLIKNEWEKTYGTVSNRVLFYRD